MATGKQFDIQENSVLIVAKCAEIVELVKGYTKEYEGNHAISKMDAIIAAMQREITALKELVD